MNNEDIVKELYKVLTLQFSGGAKMTDLIATLPMEYFKNIEGVIEAVKNSETLGVLEYSWHMGNGLLREKNFLYTK